MASQRASMADRVRQLLTSRWQGRQADMAREVGCSQAVLSRVATGKAEPGKRLLALIAAHPEVDSEWLYSGRGKPTRPSIVPSAAPVNELAVLSQPCSRDGLAAARFDSRFPARPQYSPATSYWLEVQPTDPIVLEPGTGVLPLDLLLVDCDSEKFPAVTEYSQTLCVVHLPRRKRAYQLGRVSCNYGDFPGEPPSLEAETFERTVPREQVATQLVLNEVRGQWTIRTRRLKPVRRKGAVEHVELDPNYDYDPLAHVIEPDNVVGIVQALHRRNL